MSGHVFTKIESILNQNEQRMPRDVYIALKGELHSLQKAACATCDSEIKFQRCDCGAFHCTECAESEQTKCAYKIGTLKCQATICPECCVTCMGCQKQICKHCLVNEKWAECVSCEFEFCSACESVPCSKCLRNICADCADEYIDAAGRIWCKKCAYLGKRDKKKKRRVLKRLRLPAGTPAREPYDILDEWHPSD